MTTLEENKQLARSIPEDVATDRDFDLIDEVIAEDFVEHNPLRDNIRGREEVREAFQAHLDAFPDFEASVKKIVAEDDTVAMHIRWQGTHEGTFMGVEPTGKSFEAENMVFTRIEDGKVAERWLIPDTLSILQQLGIESIPSD